MISTNLRLILTGFFTLMLAGGLAYEVILLSSAENDILASIEAADAKIGSDARSRSIMTIRDNSESELAVIEEAVLTKSDLVSFISSLEKTGRDLGLTVSITSVTSDGAKATSTSQTVRISIEAVGGWAPSLTYVRLLENLPHKIAIEKADLNRQIDSWRVSSVIRITTLPER